MPEKLGPDVKGSAEIMACEKWTSPMHAAIPKCIPTSARMAGTRKRRDQTRNGNASCAAIVA